MAHSPFFAMEMSRHSIAAADLELGEISMGFGEGRLNQRKYYLYDTAEARVSQFMSDSRSDLSEQAVEIDFDEESVNDHDSYRVKFSMRRLWKYAGPGLLMSVAYLDPGNLEGDLQAGAKGNYQLIWVLWWATFVGWLYQVLAARIGIVTGRHLAQICRYEYNKPTALLLLFFTEFAIIGSDLQEVVGSAIAFKILFGIPLWAGCLITATDAFTFMLLSYFGNRVVEGFFGLLISVMAGCFVSNFFIGHPEGLEIIKGWIIPTCEERAVTQAVAMLGAVIMPHNLYLHSALVQMRDLKRHNRSAVKEAVYYFSLEAAISLLVSFLINLCIVSVFAKGFYYNPHIGLSNAGDLLANQFGNAARIIFGIGLLAAGQSSVMTGTFAGQYCMTGFLELNWKPWQQTTVTRAIALGPALLVAVLAHNNVDELSEWLNVQQSLQLPFAIFPLLFFNSNPRIMGVFALKTRVQMVFWVLTAAVLAINTYLVFSTVKEIPGNGGKYAIFVVFTILYLCFCGYMVYDFVQQVMSGFTLAYQPMPFSGENNHAEALANFGIDNEIANDDDL